MNLATCTQKQISEILSDPVLFSEHALNMPCVSETEEKILRSKAKRIYVYAGRRWGKTTMAAIKSYKIAITEANKGDEIVFFGPSWEQCEIFLDAVRDCIEETDDFLKPLIKITKNSKKEIHINGCKIISLSAKKTSKSIRGHGRKVIYMIRDEDAFIPDCMMKQIRPVRFSKSARELVISSAGWSDHHSFRDFNSKVYESYRVSSYDNKFLDKKDLDDERELMTDAEFRQEIMAEIIDDKDSVFPQKLIDLATDFNRTKTEDSLEDISYFMGVDLGRRRDASVICIGHAEGSNLVIDLIEEIIFNPESSVYWTHVLEEIEFYAKKFHVSTINIDQTGIGDKPTEDLRNNLSEQNFLCDVKGIDFTTRLKNSFSGLVNGLLLKFEKKEIHFPFNETLIRQLKNIRFQASSNPSIKDKVMGKYYHIGHDDYVAALMLCLNAMPMIQSEGLFYTRSNNISIADDFNNPFEEPSLMITNKLEGMRDF